MRRLDVITTRPAPLEDEYGPPQELDDYVQVLIERGEPVPDRFIELTNMWRENNDMPLRDPALIASGAEFHLQGQHDQQTHGNRGTATIDSPDDGYRKLRSGEATTMAAADAVEVLRRIGRDGGDPVDLTNLRIDEHEIFLDARRHGIRARGDMPQIPAAQLDNFRAHLEEAGVHFDHETVNPLDIHSTQTELDAVKVGQMIDKMIDGTFVAGHDPWISNDDYVLDGHHRWAAFAAMEAADLAYPEMRVQRADLPIRTLLAVADEFNLQHDVTRKTIGMAAVIAEFHMAGRHDQKTHGNRGGVPAPDIDGLRKVTVDGDPVYTETDGGWGIDPARPFRRRESVRVLDDQAQLIRRSPDGLDGPHSASVVVAAPHDGTAAGVEQVVRSLFASPERAVKPKSRRQWLGEISATTETLHLKGTEHDHDQSTHGGGGGALADVELDDLDGDLAEASAADVASRFDLHDGDSEYATADGGRLYRAPDGRYVTLLDDDGGTYVDIVEDLYEAEGLLDLDELETEIAETWRQDVIRGPVYHGTTSDEDVASILAGGLERRNKTRGLNNRWVGASVFTTTVPGVAAEYGTVIEIDLPAAIADGAIDPLDLSREPGFDRADAMMSVAHAFEDYDFDPYSQFVGSGEDPNTVIIGNDVPARYLRRYDDDGQFHLKGTEHDHDQSTHAGGGGSGAVTAEFAEAPPGYIEKAQAEWRAGYEWLRENGAPPWWNGTEYIDADGLPKRENQVGHDWDRDGISEELDAFRAEVPDDVEQGIWMIGRAAEDRRKHAIQEAISMNEIDLEAAEERWGRFDIEPGRNGSNKWEELPPTLFHATSAVSAIRDSGVLKSRADVGGRAAAAGLGGGDDHTISFTDNYDVAQSIARSLHEAHRAVNMSNEDLVTALRERSGDWWSEVQASAKSVHGRDVPETIEDRFNLYRTFASWRERKEGVLDPLFFNVDPNRLAALDPTEIGVIGVNPAVDGAKGYRVSALGEWRVPTGRAVQISSTEYQDDHETFAVSRGTHQEAPMARSSRQFHLQGQHDQKTHGRRYGATRALSEPDGGFTADAAQLRLMKSGWAVAIAGTDRLLLSEDAFDDDGRPSRDLVRLTKDRIDAARSGVELPDDTTLAVGGWHNPDDGKIEVNITVVFPQSDRARAEQFARDNDQIAMADLEAIARSDWDNAIIKTGGTGGDRDRDDKS